MELYWNYQAFGKSRKGCLASKRSVAVNSFLGEVGHCQIKHQRVIFGDLRNSKNSDVFNWIVWGSLEFCWQIDLYLHVPEHDSPLFFIFKMERLSRRELQEGPEINSSCSTKLLSSTFPPLWVQNSDSSFLVLVDLDVSEIKAYLCFLIFS